MRKMRVRATLAVALVVLLALVAAGCGGGDDDDDATPAGTSEEAPGGDAGSVAGAFGSAECQRAAIAMGQAMASAAGASAGGTDFTEGFESAAAQLEAAKEAAPDDIADAIETLAAAFAEVGEKLEGIDYVPGEGPPPEEWIEAFSVFEDEEYQAASTDVSAWFEGECSSE